MALDYHNTMPPPNLNQNQPMNLIPTYPTYPHFLGHVSGNDMSHMPEKIEMWDHHDKHVSMPAYDCNAVMASIYIDVVFPKFGWVRRICSVPNIHI